MKLLFACGTRGLRCTLINSVKSSALAKRKRAAAFVSPYRPVIYNLVKSFKRKNIGPGKGRNLIKLQLPCKDEKPK